MSGEKIRMPTAEQLEHWRIMRLTSGGPLKGAEVVMSTDEHVLLSDLALLAVELVRLLRAADPATAYWPYPGSDELRALLARVEGP